MTTITLKAVQELAAAGRLAYCRTSTYGQTAAGFHSFTTEEEVVPPMTLWEGTGMLVAEGESYAQLSAVHSPRSGIDRAELLVYTDGEEIWCGNSQTFRILPYKGAPLRPEKDSKDARNLAHQRDLMRGAA
jgi:hypothetical protein